MSTSEHTLQTDSVCDNEGRIVLASASPSRRKLLQNAGVEFAVRPAIVDETAVKAELRARNADAETIALRLSELKAEEISRDDPDAWVIGADLIMVSDGRQYDKPADIAEARRTLMALRGREHVLLAGVAVARQGTVRWRHLDRATLVMRAFSNAFIDSYLDRAGHGILSSVGAYHLEGLGVQLFERVSGEFFTILGLPMLPLLEWLREQKAIAA